MATTREQAEAYAYDNRRRTTSLIRGSDEARTDPRRRLNRSLGSGIAIGVLIMAGFGIAGMLGAGRGPALPSSGAVVAAGSGDRYVVSDGTVHPALNLASALLAGGGELTSVRQSALDAAPRGLPVGIPGAPDALPSAGALRDDIWTLCAVPAENGGDPARTALYISVPGLGADEGAGAAATVLAQDEDGDLWLLAEGRRYALEPHIRDLFSLTREPVPLPRRIIATLPEGPEISVPEPGAGTGDTPDTALPFGAAVGDLAHTDATGAGAQYFLVRPDGLVSVPELVHTLLGAHATTDHPITATQAAQAPRSTESGPGDRSWPDARPVAVEPGRNQPVCVSTPPGGQPGDAPWQATVHLPATLPEPAGMTPVREESGHRLGLLDEIYIPAGSGAVVRATTSAGAGGTYTLITDSGFAYPFASPEAVERLRYAPGAAPTVPAGFVGLLPAGPVLDPLAAVVEQKGAGE